MAAAVPAPQDANLRALANCIRLLTMDAVQQAKSGHPGAPLGMAEIATVLFKDFLKFDPRDPNWPDRDRFILSNGHGSMLLYGLLYLTGYADMTLDEIKNFRQVGSRTPGHPEFRRAAGVETTTGPLGQGIGVAVGMALAERNLNAAFGDDLVDHDTYVFTGDGCLMEGVAQEAISLAGHLKLGRLILFFDDNDISIDGATNLSTADDHAAKFRSMGWHVQQIDGHDTDAIRAAIAAARAAADAPSAICCKTVIGFGFPTRQGTREAHSDAPGAEEIAGARDLLGWPHPPFEIPADLLDQWRAIGIAGAETRQAWANRLAASAADRRAAFERRIAGRLPSTWRDAIATAKQELIDSGAARATRAASGLVLGHLTAAVPELIGGSADLTPSNNTRARSQEAIAPGAYGGGYVHYGAREHAMGAVMNGLAQHGGLIPYGGTFLCFSDYCRPSIRLAALMGVRSVFVMTHDSIGLGEDGPTHQPVEHIASLRAMPGLLVFRPGDPVETAECWELVLETPDRPSLLALSRQGVPLLRGDAGENRSARGAYVLHEAEGGRRRLTLMATGSELSLAVQARAELQAEGVPTAVVSMPCWRLFEVQDAGYRAAVLGEGTARVAVEAGVELGWERYLGSGGRFVGMDSFGTSGKAAAVFAYFGVTVEAVVAAGRAVTDSA